MILNLSYLTFYITICLQPVQNRVLSVARTRVTNVQMGSTMMYQVNHVQVWKFKTNKNIISRPIKPNLRYKIC